MLPHEVAEDSHFLVFYFDCNSNIIVDDLMGKWDLICNIYDLNFIILLIL